MTRAPPWVQRSATISAASAHTPAKGKASARELKCFDKATLQALSAPPGWDRKGSLLWGWQPVVEEEGEIVGVKVDALLAAEAPLRRTTTTTTTTTTRATTLFDASTPAELEAFLGSTLWVGDSLLGQFHREWVLTTGGKHTSWSENYILVNSYTMTVVGEQEFAQCKSMFGGRSRSGETAGTSTANSVPAAGVPASLFSQYPYTIVASTNDKDDITADDGGATALPATPYACPPPCDRICTKPGGLPSSREFDGLADHDKSIYSGYHHCLETNSWGKLVHEPNAVDTLILQTGHHFWKEVSFSKSPDVLVRLGCRARAGIVSAGAGSGETSLPSPFAYVGEDQNECPFDVLYRDMVEHVAKYLHGAGFAGRVIFVTSPPGHTGCNEAQVPSSVGAARKVAANDDRFKYHWDEPQENEFRWALAFRTFAPEIPFTVLNITGLSLSRPDAHPWGDCLHYCSPGGVVGTWVDSLLGLVRKLKRGCDTVSEEKIDKKSKMILF